jgi:K+-transporting ATPase ATPase C chain
MRRQLVTGLLMTIALILLLGVAYPLVITGISQVAFSKRANGSFVENAGGKVVGSSLIGQSFTKPQYFHPRPSAAGSGYDALASGASNLGPSNPKLLDGAADDPATKNVDDSYAGVKQRVAEYRKDNGLGSDAAVPVDAVTASGSGLDPQISVANARIQARRVAGARDRSLDQVLRLVANHTQSRPLGVLGEKAVNVLTLNLALDKLR